MPIYEFKCVSCDKKIEQFCKMGEDGSSFKCPECGAGVKKILSAFRSPGTDGGSNNCGSCSSSSCSSCG